MQARFLGAQQVAHDTYTFTFETTKPLRYSPGQFSELYLPHANADQDGERRWFTIFSAPTEPHISFTTRVPAACSSYKQTLRNLRRGSYATVSEPMGDFILPANRTVPIIFVAAGIGITPVRSILKWLHDSGERRQITVLYGAHSPADFLANIEYDSTTATMAKIISRPAANWTGPVGRLSLEMVAQQIPDYKQSLLYIAGSEQFVISLTQAYKASGLPSYRLVTDAFHGYR